MFLLAIAFHFSSSIQLVQHMLILVVPHILLVRHPRFGIVAYRRINRFLQYLLEIKGEGGWNWAKRGLSVPSPKKKITLACVACLCFLVENGTIFSSAPEVKLFANWLVESVIIDIAALSWLPRCSRTLQKQNFSDAANFFFLLRSYSFNNVYCPVINVCRLLQM